MREGGLTVWVEERIAPKGELDSYRVGLGEVAVGDTFKVPRRVRVCDGQVESGSRSTYVGGCRRSAA